MTLAGHGYPYMQVRGLRAPLDGAGRFGCNVWWHEVEPGADGGWMATDHRLAEAVAPGRILPEATTAHRRPSERFAVADLKRTVTYEVLVGWRSRLPRVYLDES